MLNLATVDLLGHAPLTPSPQEIVHCLEALSHLLHGETAAAYAYASKLSPAARHELLICLSVLGTFLADGVLRDTAAAVLTPDALPVGVEGVPIGGRR